MQFWVFPHFLSSSPLPPPPYLFQHWCVSLCVTFVRNLPPSHLCHLPNFLWRKRIPFWGSKIKNPKNLTELMGHCGTFVCCWSLYCLSTVKKHLTCPHLLTRPLSSVKPVHHKMTGPFRSVFTSRTWSSDKWIYSEEKTQILRFQNKAVGIVVTTKNYVIVNDRWGVDY